MRAATLTEFGRPLSIGEVPDPPQKPGTVVVDVLATCVLPYTAEVFSGERNYPLEPPVIPGLGGVGRVVSAGSDATTVATGDLVWCDATVRSRDDSVEPDITLQGWSSRGEGGLVLSREFHDGSFATRMAVPSENVYRLPELDDDEIARFTAAAIYLVPYGGLLAIDLKAGETVLVSGATGNFGSAAVAVALAMGAGRVVATGRNERVLADLTRRFGSRVVTAALTGGADADAATMRDAAGAPVDVVIDLLPPAVDAAVVRTAAMTVREFGRIVLMGGVGMLGGSDFALPYPWIMRNGITVRGQWMYPREANVSMIQLIRSGLLDLAQDDISTFPLDKTNEAVASAAEHGGPFQRTVLLPQQSG